MSLDRQKSLILQLKAYLAGDGNLWGRMASSHDEAQGVHPSFISLAEHMRAKGITADKVEEYINAASLDLLSAFEDDE